MPRGTCEICGCTEFRACQNGCSWVDQERRFCSQCVGWVLLRKPNEFAGIMPYDLWPVRTLEPVQTRHKGSLWPVDVRRMNEEQLERTAHVAAPMLGFTVTDFLENVATGKEPFVMGGRSISIATRAFTVEEAASHIEEWQHTGKFSRGLAVRMINLKGDARRG